MLVKRTKFIVGRASKVPVGLIVEIDPKDAGWYLANGFEEYVQEAPEKAEDAEPQGDDE